MQSTRLSLPYLLANEPDDGEENENDTNGGAGESEEDQNDKDKGKDGDPQVKIKALEEEKDRHWAARQKAEEELNKLRSEKEERERGERTEVENLKSDLNKANETIATLQSSIHRLVAEKAFLADDEHNWHNREFALRSLDLSEVEINEDGSVKNPDALKKAIKKLADENPFLLKPKEDENDGGDTKPRSGDIPKRKQNSKEAEAVQQKKLMEKYPGLRGRI